LSAELNQFPSVPRAITVEEDEKEYRTWRCDGIEEPCGGTHVADTSEIGRVDVRADLAAGVLAVETTLLEKEATALAG
jgi:Ser-tRNA(Ala) deacylase AlaX